MKTEHYVLPEQEKNVDLFKGAVFNLGELKRQLAMSKSMDFLFERSSLDSREKRPLLPLNVGQVGLIGGSGLINGGADIFLDYFMLIIQGYVCTLPGSYNREIFLFVLCYTN